MEGSTVKNDDKRVATTCSDLPMEILQHIFSYLDLASLLKCRCICTLWSNCIPGDSTELRRALFFRSTTAPEPLSESCPIFYFDIHTDAEDNASSTTIGPIGKVEKVVFCSSSKRVTVHPFIEEIAHYIVPHTLDDIRKGSDNTTRSASLKNKAGELLHPAESATWKNMQATWPPQKLLFVLFVYRGKNNQQLNARPGLHHWKLWDDEGVHFQDVFEEIEEQIKGLLTLNTAASEEDSEVSSESTTPEASES
jgi:hypothetical protein